MSLRLRLTLGIGALLALALGIFGSGTWLVTRGQLIDRADDQLLSAASPAGGPGLAPGGGAPASGPGGGAPKAPRAAPGQLDLPLPSAAIDPSGRQIAQFIVEPSGVVVQSYPSGTLERPDPMPQLPAFGSPEFAALGRAITTATATGGPTYRLTTRPGTAGQTRIFAVSLAPVDAALRSMALVMLGGGAVTLALGVGAAWLVVGRALQPVDRMVVLAQQVAAGELAARVHVGDPATELGRLELALNRMLDQLETAAEQQQTSQARLTAFVGDAAHELRTPLTALRGYAELYRRGALDDPRAAADAMRHIEAEATRLQRIVDGLLQLARLDGAGRPALGSVDAVMVATEAAEAFDRDGAGHTLHRQLPVSAPVLAEAGVLRQVIDNLLNNVRVHTPGGTSATLRITSGGGRVALSVADDGPGITAADQAHVFERFWRADRSRSRQTGGSGLGLAIVASLVGAMDGNIGLVSAPGSGTTVTVTLAAATGQAEPPGGQ